MSTSEVWDILKSIEKAREEFKKTGSIQKALEAGKPYVTLHEVLRVATEEKLKKLGYRIVKREEAPDDIKASGSPDVIAEKDGEWIIAEIEPLDQLARYASTMRGTILVTNVQSKKNVEIWGNRGIRALSALRDLQKL